MQTMPIRHASTPLSLCLSCMLSGALLVACSQGEGDPCQSNRDCDDGLICRIAAGSERGACTDPSDDVMDLDSGMLMDASEPELPDDDAGPELPDDEDAGEPAGPAGDDADS